MTHAGHDGELLEGAFRRALGLDGEAEPDQASARRVDAAARLVDAAERALRDHRSELAVLFCLAAARDAEALDPKHESVLAAAFRGVRCLSVAPDAHPGGAHCVAWSPDGAMLASGGADGEVVLWSAADGLDRVASLDGHSDRVRRVEFNRMEPFVATCGDDGAAIVWDVATLAAAWRAQGKDASTLAARFNPSGRLIAVAAAPEWSGLHDVRTGETLFTFSRHDGVVVYDAVFSPDGKTVGFGARDDRERRNGHRPRANAAIAPPGLRRRSPRHQTLNRISMMSPSASTRAAFRPMGVSTVNSPASTRP